MKRAIVLILILGVLVGVVYAQGSAILPYISIFIRTLLDDANQGTARTTLGVGTGDSPGFTGLTLINTINEFSTDGTLADNSDSAVPTEKAVKTYVVAMGGGESTTVSDTTTINLTMTGVNITADGLYTAGDHLTLTGADFDVDDDFLLNNGDIGTGVYDFGGATSFEIPNDESTDATLTVLGQVHIRGDEDRISAHLGAGGEIAGEATMSFLKRISVTLDPGAWYDSSAYVDLGPILAKQYPNGIIIDYWEVTCHLNPDVEMDMDLCYSVNSFDLADPNLIDIMDTTNGVSSEDTDANINGGAAIPAGVYLYLRFGADPEGTCVMQTTTILFHGEED